MYVSPSNSKAASYDAGMSRGSGRFTSSYSSIVVPSKSIGGNASTGVWDRSAARGAFAVDFGGAASAANNVAARPPVKTKAIAFFAVTSIFTGVVPGCLRAFGERVRGPLVSLDRRSLRLAFDVI